VPFRKDIEHLEYRRALWQYLIGVLKTVHRHRLPGRRFGPDIELLIAYGAAAVICFSRGQFARSTHIANYLGIPRENLLSTRQYCSGPLDRMGDGIPLINIGVLITIFPGVKGRAKAGRPSFIPMTLRQ
jgi:hypothetical protein